MYLLCVDVLEGMESFVCLSVCAKGPCTIVDTLSAAFKVTPPKVFPPPTLGEKISSFLYVTTSCVMFGLENESKCNATIYSHSPSSSKHFVLLRVYHQISL